MAEYNYHWRLEDEQRKRLAEEADFMRNTLKMVLLTGKIVSMVVDRQAQIDHRDYDIKFLHLSTGEFEVRLVPLGRHTSGPRMVGVPERLLASAIRELPENGRLRRDLITALNEASVRAAAA